MSKGNFLQNFGSVEDICKAYDVDSSVLKDAKIYIAWYGYGNYCGSSFVLFEQNGKLYEVNGSHCSCNGLEGQWDAEETSWEVVKGYINDYRFDGEYEGSEEARNLLTKIVDEHLNKEEKCFIWF